MTAPLAYWPGDLNPAAYQSLAYSPSTNILTLSPYGNSVVLNPQTVSVSSINTTIVNTNTVNTSTVNTTFVNTNTVNTSTVNTTFVNTNTVFASTLNSQFTNVSTIFNTTLNTQTGNISTLNVSSINGFVPVAPVPVGSWINPAAPVNVSTLANAVTPVPVVSFSTVQGRAYNVSFEYGSSNLGGGGANDQTAIAIAVNGGHITIADSFITAQTYVNRYANVSAIIVGGTGGNATINVANDSAAGNVQLLNFFRLYTEDIGTTQNNF